MFGKKNFTNTQIKGRIINPEDDIFINADNNNLSLLSKYKKSDGRLSNKTMMQFKETLSDIKVYQSVDGLLDNNGNKLSVENKNLEDGLVCWYEKLINPNTGYITDKSGGNNNGILTSITENTTLTDHSIFFDGTNDYIKSTNSAISSGDNITVSVWVRPTEYVSASQCILSQVDTTANNSIASTQDFKLTLEANNYIKFELFSTSSSSSITSTEPIILNSWNHITITYNNSNIYLYLNGVLIVSGSSTLSITANETFNLGIGTTSEAKFKGYMKDIRIYNRVINTNEILELYNINTVNENDIVNYGDISLPTPNIYLKMQEGGVSSSVVNFGTSGGTATINNATWSYNNISCLYFDGTDDNVTIENSDDLTGPLTIMGWINIDRSQGGNQTLIGNGRNNLFEVSFLENENQFVFYNGNITNEDDYRITSNTFMDFKSNTWTHIAVSRNTGTGIKDIKFYHNSKPYNMFLNSGSGDLSISTDDSTVNVGTRIGNTNDTKGYINNVRIYNQELTEAQIQKIYQEELFSSSTNVLAQETNKKLKTLSELIKPELNSSLNEALLLNLTGQDSSDQEYVSDYSTNRYNATLTEGTLTYSSSNASGIGATNTLVFNGSTYLSLDGTKNNGIELKELNYNELSYSSWVYLYDLTLPRALISADLSFNSIYNIYVDTNGRINVLFNNGINDTVIFNEVLNINTWYNIIIILKNNDIKCFIGTTSASPVEVVKYDIQNNITTSNLITLYNYPYNDYFSPDDYLVAKYLFNGSSTTILTDEANNLNATMTSFTSNDLSQRGYTFDGTDNLIQLPNNDAFYTTSITFSVLFETTSTTRSDIITFNQGIDLSFSGYILRLESNDIKFIAETYKESSVPSNSFGYRITNLVTNGYSTNTLTFLTLVLNGSGSTFSLKIYKDGQELTSSITDNSNNNSFEWPTVANGRVSGYIGGAGSVANMFTGNIYDVQFYNTVLDDNIINELYKRSIYNYYYNYYYRKTNTLQIGRSELLSLDPTSNIYLKGEMDDIKVYSKALTLDEITTNWNSGDVNYFSTNNSSTDLIIKLDGEPGKNIKEDEIYSILELKMNEGSGTTLYDNGNFGNGTIYNGAVWTQENNDYINNQSIYLDGTNDNIRINDNSVDLTGAITISIWVKATDNNTEGVLFSKHYLNEFDMRFRSNYNNIRLYFGNGSTYETWTSDNFLKLIVFDTWNHIIITRDKGTASDTNDEKKIKSYINGVELTMNHTSGGNLAVSGSNNNPIYIGSRTDNSNYFAGYVSNFRIFNRELSSAEAIELYNYEVYTYEYKRQNLTGYTKTISSIDSGLAVDYTGVGSLKYNHLYGYKRTFLKLNDGINLLATDYDDNYYYGNGTLDGSIWSLKNTIHNDNSVYFDGTDDKITILNNSSINLNGALTISLWMNHETIVNDIICCKGANGYLNEFELNIGHSTWSYNNITLFNGNGTSSETWTTNIVDLINLNSWNHIAVTRSDGSTSKSVYFYVNGKKITPTKSEESVTVSTSTNNIYIGARNTTLPFKGHMSQFMIIARELSHSEILDLYNYSEGWTTMAKYGNFCYDLNTARKLEITTNETNSTCSGELWVNPSKSLQQTILKSNYNDESTRANGDIKLELVPADSNNSNLIANWNLFSNDYQNSELYDYTGNGTNLTLNSFGVTDKINGLNYNNTVLHFDGTDNRTEDTLTTGNYFYDNFNQSNFTISMWVYNQQGSADNNGLFTILENGGSQKIIHLLILNSSKIIRFQTYNGSTLDSFDTTTLNIVPNKTWTHLAFTYNSSDGTYKKRIYLNGKDVSNSLDSGDSNVNISAFTSSIVLRLGVGTSSTNNNMFGSITDLRVYNKTLSQSEIIDVMNQKFKPQLSIRLGGSITSISNNNSIISRNTWAHLAYNYNSTNTKLELYMNGDLIASNNSLTNTTSVNSNIVLGAQSFEGQINNYSAYSRNLTVNEIKQIYLGLDRLKLHLNPQQQSNSTFTSNVVIYNKSNFSSPTYIHPYGSGLSVVDKDIGFTNILSFDGSTSYILLDPESDLWRCRSFTLAMWIKPDSSGTGTNQHIFSRYLSSSHQSYYISYNYSTEELKIVFISNGEISTSIEVLKGIYTHIAIVFGLNNVNVYINGNYVKSIEIPHLLNIVINSTLKTVIGDSSDLANKYKGYIYNFRYYDTSLSTDAIRIIYSRYDLNKNNSTNLPELEYNTNDKTVVRNKDFIQPAKSSLVLHLNNYTTGTLISSNTDNNITATATSLVSSTTEFDFDGSSSYLSVADNSDINISGTALTISMWINPDTLASDTYRLLIKGQSYNDYGIYINSNNKIVFHLSPSITATSTTSITTGTWYHITAIYDGTNMNLYINGADDSPTQSGSVPANVPNSGTGIYIGVVYTIGFGDYYDGKMRDIRIYNSALSINEIKMIYNAGLTTAGEFSIAENKTLTNTSKYLYVSKYLIDDNNETADILGEIARDNLIAHYKFTGNEIVEPSENTGENESNLAYSITFQNLSAGNLSDGASLSYYSNIGSTSTATIETGGGVVEVYDNYGVKNIKLNDNGDQNEYIKITNDSNIDLSGDITLSMWIKLDPDVSDSNHNNIAISKGFQNEFDLRYDTYFNPPKLNFYNDSNSIAVSLNDYLTKGQWYHIAITREISGSTTVVNFYLNGTNIGNGSSFTSVSQSTNDIYVGARNSSGTNTEDFSAEYKNIKIYTKVLTDNEMTTLYNTDLLDFTGRKNQDSSILSIPEKMTSLRPHYLLPSKLILYSNISINNFDTSLISAGNGTINSNAIVLDGNTTSNLIIGDGANIMVNDWTYSTWYKFTSPTSKNIFLSRKETSKNFDIFVDSTDNEFKIKYNTTTTSSDYSIDTSDYDWHHLTVTKGQNGLDKDIISFYYDGELVSQKTESMALTTSATQLIIGTDNTTGFNGYMDDIRIYSSKLNDVEVAKLYSNETVCGPIHYWLMEDDTTGKTVIDSGSAGNNLVLKGTGTSWDTTSSNIKYGTRSLSFAGTTSNFASSSATGVLGSQPRAIGMWFKRSTSGDEASDQELISFGNSAVSGQQFSTIINTSSNIQINLGNNSNIRGTTQINDTNWHHLSVLQLPNEYYTDDRAIKIFIDGYECTDDSTSTQVAINTTVNTPDDLLTIGKGFKGYINEAKMYNYSLSQPEMDLLYANKNHYMINLN